MDIDSNIKSNYVVLNISGTMSVEGIRVFEKTLNQYYEAKKNIIIDLKNVTFIDSSSLGIMVLYFTRLEKRNRHIVLINVNDEINELFNISGIIKLFRVFDSLEDALDFINNGGDP